MDVDVGYDYEFDREKCWYKDSCDQYKTSECNRGCIRYMEMHYLINQSGIPKTRQYNNPLTPDAIDRPAFLRLQNIKEQAKKFVTNGDSLYIFSELFGNGKTTWAIKIMQSYFDSIWAGNGFKIRGVFIHVPTMLLQQKDSYKKKNDEFEEQKRHLSTADLVIWDDIASTQLTDSDHVLLLSYIDQRKLAGLSNIFTGNLGEAELPKALGGRLYSRVFNGSVVIELKGKDRRGTSW